MCENDLMSARPAVSPSDLKKRLRFEELIADLSSEFVNLPPDEVDHEIEDALGRVSELAGIDLAVLWQWSGDNPGLIRPTHFYPAQEGLQPPEPLHQEQYPRFVQQMKAGRILSISSLEELPAEADVDRESALLSGIKSNLCPPLAVGVRRPLARWLSIPCRRSATGRMRWSSGCNWSRMSSPTRSFAGATS
jgi:hypothetical protein